MPRAFIPALLRSLCGGVDCVDIDAADVRQVIDALEEQFPGLRDRLCDGGELKPGLTVAVDGHVSSVGLLQKVRPDSEVHFLPAIGGG